jgi:hypothetical protein
MRLFIAWLLLAGLAWAQPTSSPAIQAANGLKFFVRMVAPSAAECDLQIICVFKHNPAGDKYIEAMQDFDNKLGNLVSTVRNRGEFVGELGETLLFQSPPASITAPRVLLIGLGAEPNLSLDTLRVVGRVALREAVRLGAARVSFAPVLRDQGNDTLDVGDGDQAVAEQVVLAYDTEKRLQSKGLAPQFSIAEWVIDAGPKFFANASAKVSRGVAQANEAVAERQKQP